MSTPASATAALPESSTSSDTSAPGAGGGPGWPWALLAVAAPTAIALNEPPSVTYYNQALAALGWGLWLWWWGRQPLHRQSGPGTHDPLAHHARRGLWALAGLQALAALWSVWSGPLPIGLGLMPAGLMLAAACVMQAGWQAGSASSSPSSPTTTSMVTSFFVALMVAGVLAAIIGLIQVFMPGWTDGQWLARPTVAGRAVGNLRQPNHLSSLLVMAAAAAVWVGVRRPWGDEVSPRWMGLVVLLCVVGVVLSASRTGMLAMGLLALWGALDRQLPGRWRLLLLACPLIYGLAWLGMWSATQLNPDVAFAAKARLNDGSDLSSSRFAIWSNTLALIQQQPWTGVGHGAFNVAWTFTSFPDRPRAFFDHTHNLPLHWAVELGLPLAITLMVLAALGWWALVRPLVQPRLRPAHGAAPGEVQAPTVGACALIVTALGLHSLLEYPLWYAHFLLPVAFAWGLGLGAVRAAHPQPTPAVVQGAGLRWMGWAGAAIAACTVWNVVDYRLAAEIYAPWGRGTLSQRIERSQPQPWWGHQADYAAVTSKNLQTPRPEPQAFERTLMNLVDARLMMAYAKALAEAGEVDRARAVADRLREFKNPSAAAFFAVCDQPAAPPPFQCQPASGRYHWSDLLPSARRQ
ncbi:MAG: Wzy polymerase domain-containing protein [Aquabacterium sp.]